MAALSACVMTRDAERTIERCLRSLAFADELVVVVDTASRDRTEQIARKLATRVELHPYEGDREQKEYVTSLARHDWVLYLDGDEELSPALADEIRAVIAERDPAPAGYCLNRVTFHLGRWIRHGDWHPDWKLRLFPKRLTRFVGRNPHGRPEVAAPERRLRGDLYHYSFVDLADQLARIQAHTSRAARELYAEGRRAHVADLVLRPPLRFLRGYLLKRGFLDGMPGLVVAAMVAVSVFLKYAKLWELARAGGDERA